MVPIGRGAAEPEAIVLAATAPPLGARGQEEAGCSQRSKKRLHRSGEIKLCALSEVRDLSELASGAPADGGEGELSKLGRPRVSTDGTTV